MAAAQIEFIVKTGKFDNTLLFFPFQIAPIKKILPRLQSISFKLRFSEIVEEIRPVSDGQKREGLSKQRMLKLKTD